MKHKKLFIRLFVGIVVVLLIMVVYNCVVRSDDDPQRLEQLEAEKERQAMYADTFDVVGDYLFPNQKVSNEDMALEVDKDKKEKPDAEETKQKKEEKPVADDDIIESADISSDPTPAPPAPPAPSIEKAATPTVTTIEN